MHSPATDTAIALLAEAIFKESPIAVVKAYSALGQEIREFHSADEICAYAMSSRGSRGACVHIKILYADMSGLLSRTRIELDPKKCDGHTYRYQTNGWGLISVYLALQQSNVESFVSANSEKRAYAWSSTYPDMESPAVWHWPAVARHLRRLRRVLKLAA